jgi:hypothetical protein
LQVFHTLSFRSLGRKGLVFRRGRIDLLNL